MSTKKKRILFVCMGNICRSPVGEGVFRDYVRQRGLEDQFIIDSAGTTGYHAGEPPDPRMREATARRGYDLDGQTSRGFVPGDFNDFDLIVAMDRSNKNGIRNRDRMGRYAGKVAMMLDFHPDRHGEDVPDPYYGGPQGFDHVIDLIEACCPSLLKHLQEEI